MPDDYNFLKAQADKIKAKEDAEINAILTENERLRALTTPRPMSEYSKGWIVGFIGCFIGQVLYELVMR